MFHALFFACYLSFGISHSSFKVASEALENIKTVQSLTLEQAFFERYVDNLLLPFV